MIDNVNHLLYLEIIKMGSGRALQKSLFIRNGRGYKAELGLGFFLSSLYMIHTHVHVMRLFLHFALQLQ